MTKPITSVAAMMLWEEGRFELTDEISRWLPEFADAAGLRQGLAAPPVHGPGDRADPGLAPAHPHQRPDVRLHADSVVDALYRDAGYELVRPGRGRPRRRLPRRGRTCRCCSSRARRWGYSVATDVLGRLVEVVSGQSLDEFFAERIFAPLGMTDTRWWVDGDDASRLAALYTVNPRTGARAPLRPARRAGRCTSRRMLAGGGGLLSTAADYHRFTQMLLREGGYDGGRLLGQPDRALHDPQPPARRAGPAGAQHRRLRRDQLRRHRLRPWLRGDPGPDPGQAGRFAEGLYYWGGVASTAFWVDPAEELTAMLFTQLMPSSTYPLRPQLRQLVYAAVE